MVKLILDNDYDAVMFFNMFGTRAIVAAGGRSSFHTSSSKSFSDLIAVSTSFVTGKL